MGWKIVLILKLVKLLVESGDVPSTPYAFQISHSHPTNNPKFKYQFLEKTRMSLLIPKWPRIPALFFSRPKIDSLQPHHYIQRQP